MGRTSLCLLQAELKMGEAALPVMGSIEAGLSCSVTLVLDASRLAIVPAIDDGSTGERRNAERDLKMLLNAACSSSFI